MLKKRKILLLGPISPPISGPGVKNKMLLEWLLSQNEFRVKHLNTYDFRKFKLIKVFSSLIAFLFTRRVVLSVSKKGRFVLIPICFLLGKKVFLFPAGGSFDIEIQRLPFPVRKLFLFSCSCVEALFVETKQLKEGLEKTGFKQVVFLPNPYVNRHRHVVVKPSINDFKIVFLSKIREGKGPLLLIDAVKSVLEKNKGINVKLDFFGEIDPSFKNQFESKVADNLFATYKGVCEPHDVQKTIANYDLFVLPTFFPEGVPGAVIEAMFTGIPIIVSNYTAAPEMISNGVDGVIVEQKALKPLVTEISKLINDVELRKKLSENILLTSKSYDYDQLMVVVKDILLEGKYGK